MERERRYIYNPYLLNVIYQRLYYHDRVRLFCRQQYKGQQREEDTYKVLRENLYAEQLVADVFHTLDYMTREKFALDIYHCNFEYVLVRFYELLLQQGDDNLAEKKVTTHNERLLMMGNELPIELRCLQVLDQWDHDNGDTASSIKARQVLLAVLNKYVERHYSVNLVNYERESVKRVSLLMNIKHTVEYRLKLRQDAELGGDAEYRIEYSGEVVISMLYVFFVNELLAMAQEELALARTSYQTYHRQDECTDNYERQEQTMEHHIGLLKELYARLHSHYTEEWYAFSLNTLVFPLQQQQQSVTAAMSPVDRYVKAAPDIAKTIHRVKDVDRDEFVIKEEAVGHIRYIMLRKNRRHYEAVARRMLFDYELRRSHNDVCASGRSLVTGARYTGCCQICNYLQRQDSLDHLYMASEAHQYYTCEYVLQGSANPKVSREVMLGRQMDSLLLEPLVPLSGLIYKNAWQLMMLMKKSDIDDAVVVVVNPFHVINTSQLLEYVLERYEEQDGGPECRQDIILRQQLLSSANSALQLTEWQRDLALDIDLLVLMMHGVTIQQNEIEKYERSLSLGREHSSVSENNNNTTAELTKLLVQIYTLYLKALDGTMKRGQFYCYF
jgi:hypothetical protein